MTSKPTVKEVVHRVRFSDHCRDLETIPTTAPERTAAMAGVIGKTIHVINGFSAPLGEVLQAASREYRLSLLIDYTVLKL